MPGNRTDRIFETLRKRNCYNAPLAEADVLHFEKRYGIQLPETYRRFITELGDGGKGPHGFPMFTLERALTYQRPGVGDDFLRTPFPHTSSYNSADDVKYSEFFDKIDRHELNVSDEEIVRILMYETAGTLTLAHTGCGYFDMLVVTGPTSGQVWADGRCADYGFKPYGCDFLDWYLEQCN